CPTFADDSVLVRPGSAPPDASEAVAPGLHDIDGVPVVWWDPGVLSLEAPPVGGVRQQQLLVAGGDGAAAGSAAFASWRARRAEAIARGRRPALTVTAVTVAEGAAAADPPVEVAVEVARVAVDAERPRGRRFGSLVHAVLADVPLDPADGEVAALAA